MTQDWRIGMAATPVLRTHPYFRSIFVIRKVYPGVDGVGDLLDLEYYNGKDGGTLKLMEPMNNWKTA